MAPTDDFEDDPTVPDAMALPFEDELDLIEMEELTPTSHLDPRARCPECEDGVDGRGLVRVADWVPPPATAEEANRYTDCVATQSMVWRWCARAFFFKGMARVYWGPDRRRAQKPPPAGVERRSRATPPRGTPR